MSKKHTGKAKIIYEGKDKKPFPIFIPIIGIVIAAIIILGILSGGTFFVFNPSNGGNVLDNTVLATVNGEAIYQHEVDKQWNTIPVQTRLSISKEQLLDELISEKLLLQRAEELNISMSINEVENAVMIQLSQLGTTIDEYKETLEAQGAEYEDVLNMYQRQLVIAKLFELETSANDFNVSEEDIQNYYDENTEEFSQEAKVRVRHILSVINEEINETTALSQSEEMLSQIEADESVFCELVTNFSMDPGSVANCGEYTFGKGVMVGEFENASFSMNVGDYEIVKTDYGFHLINKLEDVEAGTLSLDDEVIEIPGTLVRDVVSQMLLEIKAKEIFDAYISELTSNSKIVYSGNEAPETEIALEESLENDNLSLV